MANITIRETDSTIAESFVLDESVVYIPGFSKLTSDEAVSSAAALSAGPKLCTSLSEFRKYFGAYAPSFAENQSFPTAFSTAAKPSSGAYMFKKGECDPGYIMATQLLSAGLSVVYDKINTTTCTSDFTITPSISSITVNKTKFLSEVGEEDKTYTFNYKTKTISNTYTSVATEQAINTVEFSDESGVKGTKYYGKIGRKSATVVFTKTGDTWTATVDSGSPETLTNGLEDYGLRFKPGATEESFKIVTVIVYGWQLQGIEGVNTADEMSALYGITGLSNVSAMFTLTVKRTDVTVSNGTISVAEMYSKLSTALGHIASVDSFSIDFITSGGYPTFEYSGNAIANLMSQIAKGRGDCVALIDHTNNPERALGASDTTSVYNVVNATTLDGEEYSAMFTPYVSYGVAGIKYIDTVDSVSLEKQQNYANLPGSYAYLSSLASSLSSNNASWLAIAGVNRGSVPAINEVLTDAPLTNAIANSYQPLSNVSGYASAINPITNIIPYGQTIWGNRTLKRVDTGLKATNFLNLRNLINDVKKVARVAAMSCMFEQNTNILWLTFKSLIVPTLDRMQTGYGIKDYKVVVDESASTKYRLVANIKLYPVYAIEEFDITVSFNEDSVNVD